MGHPQWWPYRGISNKEFNITLAYLKIQDTFEYVIPKTLNLSDLISHKNDTFIVLVYGHYTIIKNGVCLEKSYSHFSEEIKVYCYWRLK